MITEEVEAVVEEEATGPVVVVVVLEEVLMIDQTVEEGDDGDVVGLASRRGRPHFGKHSW
ncbi:unnamed protein product [Brassica oleracea var. botrytis]